MSGDAAITTAVVVEDAAPAGSPSLAKELFAGSIAGYAQVLSGQPFDIVKVRLQSSNMYSGMSDCATRIWKQEGPLAFYKGTVMPLIGIGACVSLQFAGLSAAKRAFQQRNSGGELSSAQLYASGACGGIANSVVSGPVEHVRIRLQTQTAASKNAAAYSGPLDVVRKLYRGDGIRGVYHAQGITLLREIHGYGSYFALYEAMVAMNLRSDSNLTRATLPLTSAGFFGACSGVGMWLAMYPIDVIKSRMQTDGLRSGMSGVRKYSGSVDCAQQLWREQGARGFFKGLTPTLIRAPLVNAITFVTFELTMRYIA